MVLAYRLSARIHWSRLEKRSQALRGRNLTRDIQAPVRQWRVRPLMAFVTRGRSLESHWTPDLCLRKSCGAAAFGVTACVCARFRRMSLTFQSPLTPPLITHHPPPATHHPPPTTRHPPPATSSPRHPLTLHPFAPGPCQPGRPMDTSLCGCTIVDSDEAGDRQRRTQANPTRSKRTHPLGGLASFPAND
jgi:hypothetical protein